MNAIGIIEIAGGPLMIVGLLTRLTAAVLAGDMVAAIIVSAIRASSSASHSRPRMAAMLVLLWTGPGRRALDRHAFIKRPKGRSIIHLFRRGGGPALPSMVQSV